MVATPVCALERSICSDAELNSQVGRAEVMAEDGSGRGFASKWKKRLGGALRSNSNRVSTMQRPDDPIQQSLPSIASGSLDSTVDFPIECDDSNQLQNDVAGEHPNVPHVIITRTSSEPPPPQLSRARLQQTLPRAHSATSGRSNWSMMGDYRMNFVRGLFHVWDNRLAMKLFGSRRGIKREEERLKNCPHLLIHPCSKFRIYWDLIMLVCLVLNVVFLPVTIAFSQNSVNPLTLAFSCFSDALFILDIVLNFWTGIITEENIVILDIKEIRKTYAKKWLALDILSVCPFDYIALAIFKGEPIVRATKALRLLRLIKFLSLLRLFRVVRFMHYLAKWEEIFSATKSVARIVNFVMAVLLLAHWNGCIQFLIPYIQGFPKDSWVSINHLQNATAGTQYSWAVFKAISHMLCIGFGRWPPQNTTEVWITIVSMLIGASLYAMFIGHISTLIHSVESSSRQYNERLQQVEEYMRYRKLPVDLKQKIHEYYYQRYRGQLFDEQGILDELSPPLKEDVVNFNCKELVRIVPFFADADEVFITSVITRLTFNLFLPGDYIIRCGSIGSKMYFIQHGVVDIITSNGKMTTCLCDGSYFGEISLLMKCRRVASVRAVTVCDLYSLSREDFELVLDEFPHMRRIMETIARERLSMNIRRSTSQGTVLESSNFVCSRIPPPPLHYTPTLNTIPSSNLSGSAQPEDVV